MGGRSVTTLIEACHLDWLSRALSLPICSGGIDLADDTLGVEMKGRYQKYSSVWAVHQYQVAQFREENPEKELYWAFLLYDLNPPLDKIKSSSFDRFVSERHVWFFQWDWIRQFAVSYPKTGPYVQINKNNFPSNKTFTRATFKRGILYVPKHSSLEERIKK